MISALLAVEPHHKTFGQHSHHCSYCEGDGRFSRPGSLDDVDCRQCHGSGSELLTCRGCDESGFQGVAVLFVEYACGNRRARVYCSACAVETLQRSTHEELVGNVVREFARLRAERAYRGAAE